MEEREERENNRSIEMARRLKELRVEQKLSHEALSEALDKDGTPISHDSLQNYEIATPYHTKFKKKLRMRADSLLALAQFYGVSTDYLLCETDIRNPDPNVAKMVDYLGISEENILFLHALNQKNKVSDFNEGGMEASTLGKRSPTHLEEIINIVEGLSSASPEIGKTVVELIDKLISTIEEDFVNVLHLYHEIEKSAQHSLDQRKNNITPDKIVPLDERFELSINGFEIMDSSWVRKRSWEDLMKILQSGVEAKMERDIAAGKRSIQNYSLIPSNFRFNLQKTEAGRKRIELMQKYMLDTSKNAKVVNSRDERVEQEEDRSKG